MADLKITGLTADTSPTSDDLIPTVNDPAGTPANKKVTLGNAITKAHGLSDSTVVGVASGVLTSGTDVAVADGGTGRSTSTTAYGLIAAGTTATGAHQTLAAGATTEILVGGGAAALPAWTTATGSGAPVRADTPTLVTPVIGAATGTSLQLSGLTASEIVITDASKNLASAAVATYPSLTELSYVKGVTSAVQTQINAKQGTLTNSAGLASALNDETGTGLAVFNNSPTFVDDITVGGAGVATGQIKISGTTSGTATITVPAVAGTPTYVLPAAVGGAGTFLKDAAGDGNLSWATPSGSGDVSKVGTPVNNQVGVWTGDGTLEGDTALTFDTTTDTLATGIVTVTDDAYAAGWNGSTAVPTKNAVYDQMETKAPLASPTFTGTVTVPVGLTGVLRADTGVVSVDTDVTDIVAAGSSTAQGKLELATDAETVTGTDTARATTPANITAKMAAPGAIGGTTPAAGAFTTLSASSAITASTTIELGHASDTTLARVSAGVVSIEGKNILTTDGGTLTGNITLGENTSVALDPAGSADGKYSGITVTGTGGATIAFGDLVTLDKDDSRWELVDISVAAAATGDARGIIGVAVTSSSDGGALTVLLNGIVRADANFPALTIGAPVYASTTGDIVVTQPTTTDHVIRIVGYALTADEIYFNPGNVWTTHT